MRQNGAGEAWMWMALLWLATGPGSTGIAESTAAFWHFLIREHAVALGLKRPQNLTEREIWACYQRMRSDLREFAPSLCAGAVPALHLDDNQVKALRRALLTGPRPQSRKRLLALLSRFAGKWRGLWYQNDRLVSYRHHWQGLDKQSGLWIQRVLMQPLGADGPPIPGINAVSQEGILLGAVGLKNRSSARPHLGFFVDDHSLVWVALEQERRGEACYSIYFEWLDRESYRIRGIGLTWNRVKETLTRIHLKSGVYFRDE